MSKNKEDKDNNWIYNLSTPEGEAHGTMEYGEKFSDMDIKYKNICNNCKEPGEVTAHSDTNFTIYGVHCKKCGVLTIFKEEFNDNGLYQNGNIDMCLDECADIDDQTLIKYSEYHSKLDNDFKKEILGDWNFDEEDKSE